MKCIIVFIALFLTTQAIGQSVLEIKQLLKDKNFPALKTYINTPQKSNVDVSWETLRTIVGDYWEGVVTIQENIPANDGTGGNIINNYIVNLLATDKKIFYYTLTNTFYKNKGSDKWEKNIDTVDSLFDKREYESFKNLFKQIYNDTLNGQDLFVTYIVYGGNCGIAATDSEYMEKMKQLLQDENVTEIRQWLKSPNAEKQLYAIRGYRTLVNQGYKITDEEKHIIEVIQQKKGTISTCSGCLYSSQTIEQTIVEINDIPPEYLNPGPLISSSKNKKNRAPNSIPGWTLLILGISLSIAAGYYIRKRKRNANKASAKTES